MNFNILHLEIQNRGHANSQKSGSTMSKLVAQTTREKREEVPEFINPGLMSSQF
jgi:hypothetical protein